MFYLINFKTYKKGTGKEAVKLAKIIKNVSKEKNIKIIAAVQPTEIKEISKIIPTFSQHIDPINFGANTGHILPEAVKEAGALGTLLNHSERKITLEETDFLIKRCREIGLKSMVCCSSIEECKKVSELEPDYIALEPPELIGTGRSVSQEDPKLIKKAKKISKVPLLCGAGISNKEDVKKAKELGVDGILFSSIFVKSEEPEMVLTKMVI